MEHAVIRPTASSSAKRTIPQDQAMIALLTQIMEESHHDSNSELPTTVKEALECDEGKDWEDAINTELNTLKEIETWKLEDLPEGRQPIGCKWVFVKKKDNMGKILKYKARLVAQGFSQKLGRLQ